MTLFCITSQDWGGAQAVVFALAQEYQKKNLPVAVVAGGTGELGKRCEQAGIRFIKLTHMDRGINPIQNTLALLELIRVFKKEKPSAVHLNSTMMGAVGSLAAKIASVPRIVYCIGGWVFNEPLPAWKKQLYIWIEKRSARWKDVIICVHPKDKELAEKLNIKSRDQIIVIPNGIDTDTFEQKLLSRSDARERLGLSQDAFVIGTIANAYPPKNLLWYLDTIAKDNRLQKLVFIILGDGPEFSMLKKKKQNLQLNNVILAGRIEDAPRLYRAFDIFVLPSVKEGMPITLLEAMTARIPIIATDVGGNRWMTEPNSSSIIPPNDADKLTQAILELKNDPKKRNHLAENGYQNVRSRFQWTETAKRTMDILSNLKKTL